MNPHLPKLPAGITWELLDRYFAGQANPEEVELVKSQAGQHPDIEEQLCDPTTYMATTEGDRAAEYTGPWNAVANRIAQAETVRAHGRGTSLPHKGRVNRQAMRFSGVTLGITAAVLTIVIFVTPATFPSQSESVVRTYVTAPGEYANVVLSDGSKILLGVDTRLNVVTNPANGATTATIEGQALFTVAHKSDAPFVVRTGQSQTRVLGTTFFVRQYATDHLAKIGVSEGRVAVQGLSDSIVRGSQTVLVAGAVGVVTDSGQVLVTPNVVVNDYTAWIRGRLIFYETPVPTIVADLNRAYGVEIRIADSAITRRTLTWQVETAREPFANVLQELTRLLDAHVVRVGEVINIKPGRRVSQPPSRLPSTFTPEMLYGR